MKKGAVMIRRGLWVDLSEIICLRQIPAGESDTSSWPERWELQLRGTEGQRIWHTVKLLEAEDGRMLDELLYAAKRETECDVPGEVVQEPGV